MREPPRPKQHRGRQRPARVCWPLTRPGCRSQLILCPSGPRHPGASRKKRGMREIKPTSRSPRTSRLSRPIMGPDPSGPRSPWTRRWSSMPPVTSGVGHLQRPLPGRGPHDHQVSRPALGRSRHALGADQHAPGRLLRERQRPRSGRGLRCPVLRSPGRHRSRTGTRHAVQPLPKGVGGGGDPRR